MRLSVGALEDGDARLIRDEQNVSMATSDLIPVLNAQDC